MSAASKGRAFEHAVRALFQQAGYSVIRGAASKGEFLGEKVDLVASKRTALNKFRVTLIVVGAQCKVRRVRRAKKGIGIAAQSRLIQKRLRKRGRCRRKVAQEKAFSGGITDVVKDELT